MKTLYIIRHAKSSWTDLDLLDIDRPLISRGVKDAMRVSAHLKERKVVPDIFLSSYAVRALHTAVIFARGMDFPLNKIAIKKEIYESGKEGIFYLIQQIDSIHQSIAIVGHEPTLSNLVNHFLPGKTINKFPTSSVVELTFDINTFEQIHKQTAKLVTQIIPKTMQTIKIK